MPTKAKACQISSQEARAARPGREGGAPQLRKGGVYALPDAGEYVAGVCGEGGRVFLFHRRVWEGGGWVLNMPVAYEVRPEGTIITGSGRNTGWAAAELRDTGRTAGTGAD